MGEAAPISRGQFLGRHPAAGCWQAIPCPQRLLSTTAPTQYELPFLLVTQDVYSSVDVMRHSINTVSTKYTHLSRNTDTVVWGIREWSAHGKLEA